MKRILQYGIMIVVLSSLSGCGRIMDWGLANFYQGVETVVVRLPDNALQSVIVYDQLSTRASFDAIWLSDAMRKAYVDLHMLKTGGDSVRAKTLLRRQLEENKHFISFYLLVPNDIVMAEQNPDWNIILSIGDATYAPMEIRKISILPEYEFFFGKQMSRFKSVYLVKFDAKNIEEEPLITHDTREITLTFLSIGKKATMTWPVDHAPVV